MDALSKMFWLVLVSVQAFLLGSPLFFVVHLGIIVGVGLVLGRVSWRTFLRGSSFVLVLALGILVFQTSFIHRGEPLLDIGPLTIHTTGVRQGLTTGLRILLISVAALVFVWTTNPRDLIIGLVHLGVPYRAAYAIFVAFQFVPLLEQEARIIREAHAVRGLAEVSGRFEAWKRYVVPLLAYAIRKAETAAIAMDSRAFGAYPRRTFVDDFHWTRSGLVFLAVFAVVEVGLVVAAFLAGGSVEQYSAGML
jgi:energy-coupling factor transport system permease protein